MSRSSRRKFLAASVTAAVAAAGAGGAYWWYRGRNMAGMPHGPARQTADGDFPNPLRVPGPDGVLGLLDVSGPITMVARTVKLPILAGKAAPLLAYEVEHEGRTYINPVLRVKAGANYAATFRNMLNQDSIIHWHGMLVDANNDAHPRYAVPGGAMYQYRFRVANRAAAYWYHPHPHKITGRQAYLGMASLFIVEDEEEAALQKALGLTLGVTDVPLVIQDKRFDQDGALIYAPTDDDWFGGFLGDEVLVNMTPRPHLNAAARIYRFRILNGSNARIYRLAFARGTEPMEYQVIGTDGGLIERPYRVREAFLSPGERLDLSLDLTEAKAGDRILLRSLAFDPMHLEAGAGTAKPHDMMQMGAQQGLPDGSAFDILQIRVTQPAPGAWALPARLSEQRPPEIPSGEPRVFKLDEQDGRWRINGLTFDMAATPIVVKRGNREIWEIRNDKASMPHPMHLHGFHFRVIERSGSPEQVRRVAVNERGLAAPDLGAKDTVLVWPGETVRIAVDFSHSFPGDQIYLFHCHNLEHEDQGMMLNLKVQS